MSISTSTAASFLQGALTLPDGRHPHVSASNIHMLTKCGLFTQQAYEDEHIKLDLANVTALAEKTVYLPDPAQISGLIFRVSVNEPHPDPVYALDGELLRDDAGMDYRFDGDEPPFLGGCEGVWEILVDIADYLVNNGGLLLATTEGYVAPECVRTIIDWEPIHGSSRRYLHTAPAPAEVLEFIGTGIWIDVPEGSESGILVDEL